MKKAQATMATKRKINKKQKHADTLPEIEVANKVRKMNNVPKRLFENFYNFPSYNLAQNLLGKIFVRKIDSLICKARIVETECYPGGDDKASCTFNGKCTPATKALYMNPGTLYVYMTYGMYYCLNISASEPGGAVLIRALEPLEGIDYMKQCRIDKTKSKKEITTVNLCNGPSKLCTSLQITKNDHNMCNLITNDSIWIENDPDFVIENVVQTSRIGINSAGKEWSEKPYRFYVLGNEYVSKRDLKEENNLRN